MSPKRIIIIGAGMSGAKAAHDLSAAGHEVIVLEARSRIGGRIWSNRDLGFSVDLGASWVHGIRKNPVHALAKEVGVEMQKWNYDDLKYFGENNLSMMWALGSFWEDIWRHFERTYKDNPQASVQEAIDRAVAAGKFSRLSNDERRLLVKMEVEQSYATDAKDLGLVTLMEGGEEFSGADVVFPGGYDALVKHLLASVDVRLGETVSQISYGSAGVSVETRKESHPADFVIVTVPLGVLKAGNITFDPPLPQEKQTAIEGLEMGLLNKLCLQFEEPFWHDALHFMPPPDAAASWPVWFNFSDLMGRPVLLAMNSGNVARDIEHFSDEETIAAGLASLRKIYGEKVTQPVAYKITRWSQDDLAYGSYSHLPPGAHPGMNQALAQPIGRQIYFAGEATEPQHYATVHGAFLSGERAAAEIMAVNSP